MFDSHIHSCFSSDSKMLPEAACEQAIEIGLKGIAITDHVDYDFPKHKDLYTIDYLKYSESLSSLKHKYNKSLEVLKGIELGIHPGALYEANSVLLSNSFDFVISSVHIAEYKDICNGDYFVGKSKKEAFIGYLEAIYFCVSSFKNYDVVGHIGYARRYGPYDDNTLKYTDYSDLIDSILKTVIEDGKGIEINTSGYRSGLSSTIPDIDIIKRYKELGGEIITIGSDAHCTQHIALKFNSTIEMLKYAGYKNQVYFKERKPVFIPL